MTAKTTIQALLEVVKEGSKTNFLRFLNTHSILTVSPDYIYPKDVSILIYSFATLKIFDESYWRVLESHFHYKRDEMNAHDFASCVWGFSKLPKQPQRSTWRGLEDGVKQNVMNFTTKELANVCYSFAYRDYYSKPLWDGLRYGVIRQLSYMNPIDIPLVIWAFAKVNVDDPSLWAIFEKKVFVELKNFNPLAQGTIMYAFAKQHKGSEELWNLFEKTVFDNIDSYGSKGMMNITWSFNRMGKGKDKLWNELISLLKNDMGNYQVTDAINSLCSIGQSFGLKKDFLEMIEGDLNSEEKMKKMTYGNIVKLIKLLCTNKILKHEIWDQLAMRMRQLIQDVSYFNFRTHNCFLTVDAAFWNFFVEESFLLHFERAARGIEIKDSNIWVETQMDVIDAAFFGLHKALGSPTYWHELGKYLAQRKEVIEKLTPFQTSKFLHIITKKYLKVSALKKQWLISEERLCTDDEYFNKFLENPKAVIVLIRSALATDRPQKLLKRIEQVYEKIINEENPSEQIIKLVLEQRKRYNFRENRTFKKQLEKASKEFKPEEKVEISKGILEDLFNQHLNTEYPVRPLYQAFIDRLTAKKDNVVKEEKEESEEQDTEDIKDLINVEIMNAQEEGVKDPIEELAKSMENSTEEEDSKEILRGEVRMERVEM